MPVEKIGQRLARHAKSFGGFPPRQAGRLETGFPDPLRRGASWFVPFRRSVVADQIKVGYVFWRGPVIARLFAHRHPGFLTDQTFSLMMNWI
jgi:hypothetical protein